jgi:membrane protein implicated in regulation of membrane protease activity
MKNKVKLLDVVALTEELPEKDLQVGQVGTVVEVLAPDVYEVEFSDNDGRAYAELALHGEQLLVLHYEPAFA